METQSLEFKGLKRRPQSTFVNGNTAVKAKPEKKTKKMEAIPGGAQGRGILGKALLTFFYIGCISLFIGSILVYINLQSELSNSVDKIASLQGQYEDLKKTNDEDYAEINNSIDNEEIRRIAIEELGMHYASEGQIVSYSDDYVNDYVRVYSVIH